MGMPALSELRWALLILGVAFFAGLTLWELRRPRQARHSDPGPPPPRPRALELELPEMHAREPIARNHLPLIELPDDPEAFPVLAAAPAAEGAREPLAPAQDEDAAERRAPLEADLDVAPQSAPAGEPPVIEASGPTGLVVEWPPDDERRIVALRLVAPQPERFAGRSLRQALAAEGFVLGRFDIFHKGDEERRAVLSAASLNRPGTFDAETMDSQHFGGLSLFAVLPGPMSPPEAFEELVTTARSLNDRLCGVLQDEGGVPLTPARIATLRERLAAGAAS